MCLKRATAWDTSLFCQLHCRLTVSCCGTWTLQVLHVLHEESRSTVQTATLAWNSILLLCSLQGQLRLLMRFAKLLLPGMPLLLVLCSTLDHPA